MGSRPDIWVGHVTMSSTAMAQSADFLEAIGLRPIFRGDTVAVLELRGGTHIVVEQADSPTAVAAPFDFMVEDLTAIHARFIADGLNVSAISTGRIHDSFELTEPGGNKILFNSTHVPDHALV